MSLASPLNNSCSSSGALGPSQGRNPFKAVLITVTSRISMDSSQWEPITQRFFSLLGNVAADVRANIDKLGSSFSKTCLVTRHMNQSKYAMYNII